MAGLKPEDCKALCVLLQNGFTFRDSLHLFETKTNEKTVKEIIQHLDQGERVVDFIERYIPEVYAVYFSSFLLYMPLKDALQASMEIVDHETKTRTKLIKDLMYPLLLFYGTQCGVLLFHYFIFPSVTNLLDAFETDVKGIALLQQMMTVGSWMILCVSAAGIMLWFVIVRTDVTRWYCLLFKARKNALPIRMASVDFARFYRECVKLKLSTRDAVAILMQMKKRPLVSFIAKQLNANLSSGEDFIGSMENCYVEETLMRFMKIAVYSSDCETQISGYLKLNEERQEEEIRKLTTSLQVISYASVGILLILVYQVLLLPMNMLQNI